jgi:CysZ protein
MIKAFLKGLAQLNDPHIRKIIIIAIFESAIIFIALWVAVGIILETTSFSSIVWLEWVVNLMGGLATLILTWVLFPPVISVIICLHLPYIASSVEARHYPDLEPPTNQPIISSLFIALRYLGVLVLLNFVLLVFLVFGPLFPFVFYSINGYILGKEYFELVALRRLSPVAAKQLYLLNRGKLLLVGVLMSILLTLPIINIIAPVVITASMVHLFESWRNIPKNQII